MTQLPVVKITENATVDCVDDATYHAILSSLVDDDGMSFQDIATATGYRSKAWWHHRYTGARPLDEESRNALRRLSGEFPAQPPSVTSVTEAMIHPDAAMWLVGELEPGERVRRVLMLAETDAVLTINGDVKAERKPAVTDGTPAVRREPVYRPVLPVSLKARIEASGVDVATLIEAGLAAMEATEYGEDVRN